MSEAQSSTTTASPPDRPSVTRRRWPFSPRKLDGRGRQARGRKAFETVLAGALAAEGKAVTPVQALLISRASGLWWRLSEMDAALGDGKLSASGTRAYLEMSDSLRLILHELAPSKPPKPKQPPQHGFRLSKDGKSLEFVGFAKPKTETTK